MIPKKQPQAIRMTLATKGKEGAYSENQEVQEWRLKQDAKRATSLEVLRESLYQQMLSQWHCQAGTHAKQLVEILVSLGRQCLYFCRVRSKTER